MTSAEVLHWPDRGLRAEKQKWRLTLELLERAFADARGAIGRERPRVALSTPLAGLADALGARLDLRLDTIDHAGATGRPIRHESRHVVAVTHPEVLPLPIRMKLLRRCVRVVRPAGRIVVIATVVGRDRVGADGVRVSVPTCSGLLEQLEAASGQGLMVESLESVRWGDEPVRRGVALVMTRISPPTRW